MTSFNCVILSRVQRRRNTKDQLTVETSLLVKFTCTQTGTLWLPGYLPADPLEKSVLVLGGLRFCVGRCVCVIIFTRYVFTLFVLE